MKTNCVNGVNTVQKPTVVARRWRSSASVLLSHLGWDAKQLAPVVPIDRISWPPNRRLVTCSVPIHLAVANDGRFGNR